MKKEYNQAVSTTLSKKALAEVELKEGLGEITSLIDNFVEECLGEIANLEKHSDRLAAAPLPENCDEEKLASLIAKREEILERINTDIAFIKDRIANNTTISSSIKDPKNLDQQLASMMKMAERMGINLETEKPASQR